VPGSIKLLFLGEAAERLRVSYYTIHEWVVTGKLRAVRLAGRRRWQVDERDLDAFIEGSKLGPERGPKPQSKSTKLTQNQTAVRPVTDRPYEWMGKYAPK
jgi:excisionase family DNA binding protein